MPALSISIVLVSLAVFSAPTQADPGEPSASRPGPDLPLTRYELPLPGKPVGVAAFETDGDEALELVAATRSPGGVAVWEDLSAALSSDGTPRFIPLADYLVGPLSLPAFGDAPARLAVASQETSKLYFLTAEDFAQGAPAPEPALDLPGVPRFLCAGPNGSVYVFTRTNQIIYVGPDGFGRVTYSEHDQLCAAMRLTGVTGDLDPGSLPMLVVGSQTDRVVAVYRADPEAKSGWRVLFDFEFDGIPRAFSTADLDGDGDLELLIAGGDDALWALGCGVSGGMNAWLEQDPLQPKRHRLTSVPIALHAAWTLTMSGQALASLSLAEKDSLTRTADVYAGQGPVAFAHADLDGDGIEDIAAANREARRVSILLGEGESSLHAPLRAESGRGPSELSVLRPNADPSPQGLLVLSSLDGRWSRLQRSADGTIARTLSEEAPPQSVALTAVHGAANGAIGIATLSAPNSNRALLSYAADLEAPNALAEASSARVPCGASAGALLAMNLDADRIEEIIVTDPASNRVRVFEVSEGALRERADLELSPAPQALARGQASDFFVVVAGSGRRGVAHLSWNSSSGALVEIDRVETPKGEPIDAYSPSPSLLYVLESRGPRDGAGTLCIYEKSGAAWNAKYESATGFRPYALAGSADQIVVSAQNSHHLNYYTRAGEQWTRRPDLGCGTGPLDVALFDFNGDQILDIATANAFSDDVTVTIGR